MSDKHWPSKGVIIRMYAELRRGCDLSFLTTVARNTTDRYNQAMDWYIKLLKVLYRSFRNQGGQGHHSRDHLDTKPVRPWGLMKKLLGVPGVAQLMNLMTASRFAVVGDSMIPTLISGQYLLVSRLNYLCYPPVRGDVIILQDPAQPGVKCVKRVIGLPGERLVLQDGLVFVDGQILDEPYTGLTDVGRSATFVLGNVSMPRTQSWEWYIGDNWYFVMGDYRLDSRDSRNFGPVSGDLVIGKAWVCYWPPGCWGVLH